MLGPHQRHHGFARFKLFKKKQESRIEELRIDEGAASYNFRRPRMISDVSTQRPSPEGSPRRASAAQPIEDGPSMRERSRSDCSGLAPISGSRPSWFMPDPAGPGQQRQQLQQPKPGYFAMGRSSEDLSDESEELEDRRRAPSNPIPIPSLPNGAADDAPTDWCYVDTPTWPANSMSSNPGSASLDRSLSVVMKREFSDGSLFSMEIGEA